MNIDIERLKVDESLWPEGSTHCNMSGSIFVSWMKKDGGAWYAWTGDWSEYKIDPGEDGCFIPRPAKPAEVEWDVVEAELHEGENCWYEAVVIGQTIDGSRKVVQWVDSSMAKNSVSTLMPSQVRRIPSKAQRDRDDLEELISTERERLFPEQITAKDVAELVIKKYNLEPKK